jgi:hypothetical protein
VKQLRSASGVKAGFPYTLRSICYIEIAKNGAVTAGADAQTYERAQAGESTLYAVWPGEWSSDLFVIDDLDAYARAKALIHDEARTGLADHDHDMTWSREPHAMGGYTQVSVRLNCGCLVLDIRAFARQMRDQRGWEIATTGGCSGGGSPGRVQTYSVCVKAKSLEPPI